MEAKLDELVFAVKQADSGFIGIAHLTELKLDAILDEVEKRGEAIHAGNPAMAIPGRRRARAEPKARAGFHTAGLSEARPSKRPAATPAGRKTSDVKRST